ncbi:hypothetical protein Scep_013789 [Stephania cephalantha]|uniref:Uncharacterized protein n=1 Tax=Stephania cephalantha TaxID=152367 RepID=A0AAP0NZR0_9MAGN
MNASMSHRVVNSCSFFLIPFFRAANFAFCAFSLALPMSIQEETTERLKQRNKGYPVGFEDQ